MNGLSISYNARRVLLICGAGIVSFLIGYLVQYVFELPLFLDSIGTVLVGALMGPVAGALFGASINIVGGMMLGNTTIMPFAITAAVVGWIAGYTVENGAFRNLGWAIITGALVGVLAALVSAPISTYVFTGVTDSGIDHLIAYFEQTSRNLLQAATLSGLIADPIDKALSFVVAYFLWKWLRPYFPRPVSIERRLHGVTSYDAAVILGLLTMVICWIFLPAFGRSVFSTYYIVVLASAWYGGIRGGLAAMFFGLIAPILLLHSPFTDLGFGIEDGLQLALFLSISLFIIFITDARETALRDLRELHGSLRKSEGQLRAITEGVVESLVLISPQQQIVSVNGHFRDLISLSGGQVVGKSVEALQPRLAHVFGNWEELSTHLSEVGKGGDPFVAEVTQVWPVSRELELFSTAVSSEDGEDLGRLFVFRDVTRERSADRMKSQFLSMVSHELRTPLTSIVGFTEMILNGDSGEVNEEQVEFLEIVSNNADRLLGLVNDLLDTSRMESGRIDLTLVPVDVAGLIHDVSMDMRYIIEDKDQTLVQDIAKNLPPVLGDRNRLVQVLTNLVSNAHKFSPEGGTIRLAATEEDGVVRLAVSDTGYGISEEDQKLLFTRFYRVNNSLTREIGGSGMGLNIVKQIVECHEGEITVESVEGEGSTFAFTVPAAKDWIEDEADIALLVRRNLERPDIS